MRAIMGNICERAQGNLWAFVWNICERAQGNLWACVWNICEGPITWRIFG